ncbi:HEPN domain-containing protein [Candidatus Micrarchaeota archaeon]|nr:HEPN domain-containing protein [Candidatus Micrarchaeota archaeon]MBD3417415.1 HEPN domain-containing protein [Candidatus Micrarchaeota archaeon]
MEKAQVMLEEAEKAAKGGSPNSAVLAGYAAMFDGARALLFKDGYRERSHACVARYLEANYSEKLGGSFVDLLDEYREKRHKVSYSSEYYPTVEEAKNLLEFAGKFLEKIEKLVEE